MEVKIDARGLLCPKPVIETKKALEGLKEGNIITLVDNQVAKDNVSKLAKSLNLHFCVTEADGNYEISIFKGAYAQSAEDMVQKRPDLANLVILVGKDTMGDGERELGEVLIKSYFYALSEAEPYPKAIIFINSGIRLTTMNLQVIEYLKKLSDMGTEILSCGTCLDYYGLKDMLQIGGISNMYTIVELMNEANNTITL
ncbi:sulfurtransferase-like selenium metabolism protein YedF [Fusibacter bizertensis]|uniref:Sulfurtransferase-like selenium metabolism protein YedF n=1 Tax=Fusibacter bizertensis TaxID=1488331 RepID=A0ABT6NFK2_9FIRM|nr:sulfurtransferase-like selenium metabolism protein YedF [Fusibacter bizertensis]MDH8679208.1 sulfurtransferase-like selenium metabolism protein YedF [Fusibacter bizertensis]